MRISLRTKLAILVLLLTGTAVGLLSSQSLRFFSQDKETYIYDFISQASTSQADQLDKKITSLKRMLALFDKFSTYRLSISERERFLNEYEEFLFIGNFSYSGGKLRDNLIIADRNRLQSIGLRPSSIKKSKDILDKLKLNRKFALANVTMQSSGPAIALILRGSGNRVIIGVVSQRDIADIYSKRSAYEIFLVDQMGQILVHSDGATLLKRTDFSNHPMVATWIKNPDVPVTKEFTDNNNNPILGATASLSNSIAGVFVEVPKGAVFLTARRLIKDLSVWAGLIFIGCFAIGLLFAVTITRPIKKLAVLTRKVAKGDFTVKAQVSSNDEIGELVESFNMMSDELKSREDRIEQQHKQLVQSEKMSAFGQMSAGIAHEVKNPLTGILGYAQLAKRKLDGDNPSLKYLNTIEKETVRCKEIIDNLMKFARQEKTVFAPFSINQTVKDAVDLVDHQITIVGVKIERNFADDSEVPQIVGNANQIQQVLMNLMLNAQHAMVDSGTLTVATIANGMDKAVIKISDTGHGIAPENLKKIFEPFFTTKEAGKGTGLGLAVTYGIIKDHYGDIAVDSEVGKGTTFTITLPTDNESSVDEKTAAKGATA